MAPKVDYNWTAENFTNVYFQMEATYKLTEILDVYTLILWGVTGVVGLSVLVGLCILIGVQRIVSWKIGETEKIWND